MKQRNWESMPLGKVADLCLGKMLDQNKNRGDLLPYLANINVRWGEFILDDLRTMRFESKEHERYGLKYGDIVMCEGGEPGRCAIWKDQVPGMMIQKALHRIRPKELLDYRFLFYSLLHIGQTSGFDQYFTGATIKHLPGEKLAKVEIDVPPRSVQERIAGILSAYDELIENNQRRIHILENMARSLYREWFVHFRYPGHESVPLVDSPLGPVPKGWEVGKLKDVCLLTMGSSPKSEFYNESGEGLPFHQGVTNFGERFPIDRLFCTVESRMAETGDILFSVRAPVGRMNISTKKIVIGRGLSAIRHKQGNQAFLWEQLRAKFSKDDMIGNGSIFASVTKDEMQQIELLCPSQNIIQAANRIFEPIHHQIEVLSKQAINLRCIRDLLLPRLLSGQISLDALKP